MDGVRGVSCYLVRGKPGRVLRVVSSLRVHVGGIISHSVRGKGWEIIAVVNLRWVSRGSP